MAETASTVVTFRVRFNSRPGQDLYICGAHPSLGDGDLSQARALSYTPSCWTCEATLAHRRRGDDDDDDGGGGGGNDEQRFTYRYYLSEDGGKTLHAERGSARELQLFTTEPLVADDGDFCTALTIDEEVFDTAAFRDVIFARRHNRPVAAVSAGARVLHLQILAVRVAPADEVCVQLGDAEPTPLSSARFPLWEGFLPLPAVAGARPLRYRYIIRDGQTRAVTATDALTRSVDADAGHVRRRDYSPITPPSQSRFAGVAIPVFSLRTHASTGVGEFLDLLPMVDLARRANLSLVQLLPVNDTTVYGDYRDSYPYSCMSVHALHPQYIRIDALDPPQDVAAELTEARARLNKLPDLDFEAVMAVKMPLLRRMYLARREQFLRDPAFLEFFRANQWWLAPYAVYRFLMLVNGTADFDKWGAQSRQRIALLAAPDSLHFDHIGLHYYIQYHLHRQLAEAAAYAKRSGVALKGDLPIGVNRHCVETWVAPELFRLGAQTGAPPDQFAEFGQNWRFPTYDWEHMAQDDYAWWGARLRSMGAYFHAYRIDHILGFFRIWEIPAHAVSGLAGRFRPVLPIRRAELERVGLWDMERLCTPYVTEALLREAFGDERWWQARDRFFEPWLDRFRFREEYGTERRVEAAALEREQDTRALFRLLNNVVLLRDTEQPDDAFHPRIELWRTSSFAELGGDWQYHLRQLYHDYFYRRQDVLWRRKALEKLPMMKSASGMLVCGEDLGMLPACVFDVLADQAILGLRVQRMPEAGEFGNCAEYAYLTVATPSSHDTSTVRGWWEEMPADQRQRFYERVLMHGAGDRAPAECTPQIVEEVVRDHLASPSIWAVFPLQDLLGVDGTLRRPVASEEQINVPSNPKHYWRFRMHLPLETLLKQHAWLDRIGDMVKKSGRAV